LIGIFIIVLFLPIYIEVDFIKKNKKEIKISMFTEKIIKNARKPLKKLLKDYKGKQYYKIILLILVPLFMILYSIFNKVNSIYKWPIEYGSLDFYLFYGIPGAFYFGKIF